MKAAEQPKNRLSQGLFVRLPEQAVEVLMRESERDGIPISALIRRAVLRELRLGGGDRNTALATEEKSNEATS